MFRLQIISILTLMVYLICAEIHQNKGKNIRLAGAANAPANVFYATVNILTGKSNEDCEHLCQGVMISPNMTITAASCLYDAKTNTFIEESKIFLRGGSLDKTEKTNPLPVNLKAMVIHPQFRYYPSAKKFGDDLALLVPSSDFLINNSTIGFVPMAKKQTNNTKDAHIKYKGYATSWGKIQGEQMDQPIDGPNILQLLQFDFMTQQACADLYKDEFELPQSSVCINDAQVGVGICKGDAGAGIFVKDTKSGNLSLVAIASQESNGFCPPQRPSVVTRVAPSLTWINTNGGPKAV